MKNILLLFLLVLCVNSCKKEKKQVSTYDLLSTESPDGFIEFQDGMENDIVALKPKYENALLPPLPDSLLNKTDYGIYNTFLKKDFVNNMDAAVYDIKSVVGHLFVKSKNGYNQVSITPFIKSDTVIGKYVKKDIEYVNQKVTDKYDVSITIAFLELGSDKERTFEMLIKDEAAFILENKSINKPKLKILKDSLGLNAKNYFFSKASTLSSITHKTFEKTNRIRGGITATWMTAKGNKFVEEKNMTYIPKVHVDLINLNDMILD